MFARVSRYRGITHDPDEFRRASEEKIVPQVQSLPGFVGLQVLQDADSDQSLSITYWETQDAMRASEEEANRIREEGNELTGGETVQVERFEVVLRVGL
jgi:heme-degrading monooxygenase HmoA